MLRKAFVVEIVMSADGSHVIAHQGSVSSYVSTDCKDHENVLSIFRFYSYTACVPIVKSATISFVRG
jgi:hypothetical protein